MTPASFSYKSYSRQARTLTEETGFSGGMLWAGNNNIDSTHLKTIVNFDYDDTTGFLKTRPPLDSTAVCDVTGKELTLLDNVTAQLIGVYDICPVRFNIEQDENAGNFERPYKEVYQGLDSSGELYLFGNITTDETTHTYRCTRLQALFKDNNSDWSAVDCANINTLFNNTSPTEPTMEYRAFTQLNQIKPVLYDNILYFTDSTSNQVFTACRVETIYDTNNITGVARTIRINLQSYTTVEGSDWIGYKNAVDEIGLITTNANGYNAARGSELYVYPSTKEYDASQNVILGAYFAERFDDTVPLVEAKVGQTVTLCVKLNGTEQQDQWGDADNYIINIFKQTDEKDENNNTVWEPITWCGIINPEYGYYHTYKITEPNPTFGITVTRYTTDTSEVKSNAKFDSTDNIARHVITLHTDNNSLKLKMQPYNLNTAKASCMWNNHLVLWGCDNFKNTLFVSEPGNFYYFPVPNNVLLTDTDIISCIPYLDSLLVFTTSKLYKVSVDNNGSFIQEVIQNNMPLSESDAPYIQAIKNMVLFKSGKYFYMIVPKSQSLTGELTVAPIYKNVAGLLNDLRKGTTEILSALYPERSGVNLFDNIRVSENPTHIYAARDTVYILYEVYTGRYNYMLFLNYDTNLRAWTTYIVDITKYSLAPAKLTVAQTMSFIRVEVAPHKAKVCLSFLNPEIEIPGAFRSLIDTGYRTLSASLKKRFREVQLKLYCMSEKLTAFGSSFFVDGVCRRDYIQLTEVCLDDRTVTLTPDYSLNTFFLEPTMSIDEAGNPAYLSETMQQTQPPQGSDAIVLSDWKLDFSHFKREAPITVRIPVSGKGYSPRFILMTPDSLSLCVNEINWVYRLMYGR